MATTKMTRKGQVTIPIEIRERLNLTEGVVLSVREEDGKVIIVNPMDTLRASLENARLAAQPVGPFSADQADDIVAAAIIEEYKESIVDR